MEQSKDLFVKMQEQMQNTPSIFNGFPFPAQASKTEKE
jgi:hypothetical protein